MKDQTLNLEFGDFCTDVLVKRDPRVKRLILRWVRSEGRCT